MTKIKTFRLEELLGTKLRALYQRRKGRDLYDLYIALTTISNLDEEQIILCFREYTNSNPVLKKDFIQNIELKLGNNYL